jgi:hypothetical protein
MKAEPLVRADKILADDELIKRLADGDNRDLDDLRLLLAVEHSEAKR